MQGIEKLKELNMMDFITKSRISNTWLALILITITVAVIYSNIYDAPFVFDDAESIVENVEIKDFGYYSSFEQILKPRNIVYLTFAINYKLCGLKVAGYHITNISIHIVNGFLVYLLSLTILKRLNKASRYQRSINLMSIIAALIFVAHPIQTQAITYTVQRFTSMAAMFYMASVFFYLKARLSAQDLKLNTHRKFSLTFPPASPRQNAVGLANGMAGREWRSLPGYTVWTGRACYIIAGFCGILAFLSKQNAASLPGAIILVEYLCVDRTWRDWKKIIPWYAFSFTLWTIFILYSSSLFSVDFIDENLAKFSIGNLGETITSLSKPYPTSSRWVYLCTQLNVLVIYVRLLFLPVNQNIDYMYSFKSGFFDDYTPIAFLFLMGLVGVGVWSIRKRPIISLAIFWFFITLSIESSIIPVKNAMFEHRLYLPMFGFAIFASWLLFHFLSTDDNPRRQSWIIISYTVIIVSLCAATYHRNVIWQDKTKLWSDVILKSPKNYRAHINLGWALAEQGKSDEAVIHYYESLRINPDVAKTHVNLGDILLTQSKFDKAIFHFKEALRIKPSAVLHNNIGIAMSRKGNHSGAILHYKEALQIDPNYAKAYYNLGNTLLLRLGRNKEAIVHYKEALRTDSGNAKIHNNLGIALYKEHKFDEAALYFKKALGLDPDNPEAHNNLGRTLARSGKFEEAIVYYKEALKISPDFPEARRNLELTLEKVGK